MLNRLPMLLTSVAVGIAFAGAALMLIGSEAKARPASFVVMPEDRPMTPPNERISRLFVQVTEKRLPPKEIAKAIAEVRKLQRENVLRSGSDYYSAGVVAAKGSTVEDALYAHDLAVCALALGDTRAAGWAALTQDQLLTRLNRKQRFGTQAKNGKLVPVAADVADGMRLVLGLPSLIAAKRMVERGQSLDPTPAAITARKRLLQVPSAAVATATE